MVLLATRWPLESLGVYNTMSQKKRPTGHLQVKTDKNGRARSFWAFWPDRNDKKGGRRLGPGHIRESGGQRGHEGRGGAPRGRGARNVEAPSARLLSRGSARRAASATGLQQRGNGAANRRPDRQASENEALEACDPGRPRKHATPTETSSLHRSTTRCVSAGSTRTRWPRSSVQANATITTASCAATTSTTRRRSTVSCGMPPACSRKRFGCAVHTQVCVCRARRWGCDGAPSISRRVATFP